MAEHPSFTLAALLPAGGVFGYMRTRSAPSLIAGVGLGLSYAYSGYLIKENRDYGTELALGNSVLLLGSAIPRIIKTGAKAPVPLALGATGLLASYYYQKKVREFRFGVYIVYGGRGAITEAIQSMVEGFQGGNQKRIANLGRGVGPSVKPEDLAFFFEIHRSTAS